MRRLLFLSISTILANTPVKVFAQTTTPKPPLNGQLVKNTRTKTQPAPQKISTASKTSPATGAAKPRYHIDFTPADKSSKRFDNFQSSLPDKAVKTYLHKIKAEPTSISGITPTPEGQAAAGNQAPSTANTASTTADTGSTPRVLTPSGVAIPQAGGSSSSFFK